MKKRYMLWWHSSVDKLYEDPTTIKNVADSISKTLDCLNELKELESKDKIKVKKSNFLNPLFIEITDQSVEKKLVNDPIVDFDVIG